MSTSSLHPGSFAGPRAFARHMLADDRLRLRPLLDQMQSTEQWSEMVLFRESCWQAALIIIRPNVLVPKHRHLRVASCDIGLGGSGLLTIEPVMADRPADRPMRGPLAANLIRIPKGAWHGGPAGPQGGAFLSFQQWDGEPGFIAEDWEAFDA